MVGETTTPGELIVPIPRRVPVDRPWVWLEAGWRDFCANPFISIIYGGVFVVFGWLLAWLALYTEQLWLIFPLTSGFFIVAPVIAIGLYETSRKLEAGEKISLINAFCAWRINATQIGLLGFFLLIVHLAWVRVAQLMLPIFYGSGFGGTLPDMGSSLLQSDGVLPLLVFGTLVGGIFATFTFVCCAFAIPFLMDRPQSMVTDAMRASLNAIRTNPSAMIFWAVLIVLSVGLGLVLLLFGLAIVLPVIGYATWHAYKDVFRYPRTGSV